MDVWGWVEELRSDLHDEGHERGQSKGQLMHVRLPCIAILYSQGNIPGVSVVVGEIEVGDRRAEG